MAEVKVAELGGERREEDAEAEDEAADDGRESRRPTPAEERHERRKHQRHTQRRRREAAWKRDWSWSSRSWKQHNGRVIIRSWVPIPSDSNLFYLFLSVLYS